MRRGAAVEATKSSDSTVHRIRPSSPTRTCPHPRARTPSSQQPRPPTGFRARFGHSPRHSPRHALVTALVTAAHPPTGLRARPRRCPRHRAHALAAAAQHPNRFAARGWCTAQDWRRGMLEGRDSMRLSEVECGWKAACWRGTACRDSMVEGGHPGTACGRSSWNVGGGQHERGGQQVGGGQNGGERAPVGTACGHPRCRRRGPGCCSRGCPEGQAPDSCRRGA